MVGLNGGTVIQGCAYRITRLTADGSCATSAVAMVQDNLPLVKIEAKPNLAQGVDITPISACGVPVISYKDVDRYKRWDITASFGDFDPEQMELTTQQGSVLTAGVSAGRTFTDGVVTVGEYYLDSAALAAFVATDVGRSVTATGVPMNTFIVEVISATRVRMNNTATATEAAESTVLGSLAAHSIGYAFPHLLIAAAPAGVAIEVWSKLITRGSGYQGFAGFPTLGQPAVGGSGYVRTGIFRAILTLDAFSIENKEGMTAYTGWAIENPNFATGPLDDWRTGMAPGSGGGTPLDTTAWCNMVADFALPSPTQAGYQVLPVS